MAIELIVNTEPVEVLDESASLLGALREELGLVSVKDGCSPQGQCGCCTVWVDGSPRVACVTPVRRLRGRHVITLEGLDSERAAAWAEAMWATGASQCGFCTPGIIMRLEALTPEQRGERSALDRALLAHLCRCTGWQTIREAACLVDRETAGGPARDETAAAERARCEGGTHQRVGPRVALGEGGFADDRAPAGCRVAVPTEQPVDGERVLAAAGGAWAVGATLAEAQHRAAKIQGRRSTREPIWPLELPPGDWERTLRTTWVEPAYLEPDASWCEPGGEPASPLANGGAFGAKRDSPVAAAARELADALGQPVRVQVPREWAVRHGPKRPPLALGVRRDGTGLLRVVATEGVAQRVAQWAPGIEVETVEVPGPPTSMELRAAVWAELALLGLVSPGDEVLTPAGGRARAELVEGGGLRVSVAPGPVLDATVLRSYVIGAAHQAAGWVGSEAISVDEDGVVHDLTIRSFGILRSVDWDDIDVVIESGAGPAGEPVPVSDAAFVAVARALWSARGCPERLPFG